MPTRARDVGCDPIQGLLDSNSDVQNALEELAGEVYGLRLRVKALENLTQPMTYHEAERCFRISGVNVYVEDGTGHSESNSGLGNLIVGYNAHLGHEVSRTGAHNLILGNVHSYDGNGCLVAGYRNSVSGNGASVLGGTLNVASGNYSCVSGGRQNVASGELASVTGGNNNEASGRFASVSGGGQNTASGNSATVAGGDTLEAQGPLQVVPAGGTTAGTLHEFEELIADDRHGNKTTLHAGAIRLASDQSGPTAIFGAEIHIGGREGGGGDGKLVVRDQLGHDTVEIDGRTGDVVLSNADCAEEFPVVPGAGVEPGDVVVLGLEGDVQPCSTARDARVAGVVSGAGRYRPGVLLDRRKEPGRVPVAMLGKVFCKVDASFGAVEVGTLLVTSPNRGHAMAANGACPPGVALGKAMAPLRIGCGLLPVLVALQ